MRKSCRRKSPPYYNPRQRLIDTAFWVALLLGIGFPSLLLVGLTLYALLS